MNTLDSSHISTLISRFPLHAACVAAYAAQDMVAALHEGTNSQHPADQNGENHNHDHTVHSTTVQRAK